MAPASSAAATPVATQQPFESRRARRARELAESPTPALEVASVPVSGDTEVRILRSSTQPKIRPRVAAPAPKVAAPRAAPIAALAPTVTPVSAAVVAPQPAATPAPKPVPTSAPVPQPALAEGPAPAPSPAIGPESPAEPQATTGPLRFRFDVGTIPLAPHSAKLPLAAPVSPDGRGDNIASITEVASISLGRILRRSLSVTLAAASVAGLILTAAIPALAPIDGGDTTQAAAIQQLSLGGSSATSLTVDVVEGVDGAEVAADAALIPADTFVNNPFGIVQYPFSTGVPLTDTFGYRTAPIAQFHDGQDFAAGNGAAIRSIADGTVLESGPTTDGCGTGIKISHKVDGLDVTSRYCHMQEGSTRVEVGNTVNAGQMIGRVGATGMAFGEHLHLVIEIAGEPVDPMPFFAKYNAVSR